VTAGEDRAIVLGPFRLDRHRRSLTRDGVPLAVGARALDVLMALASAGGETVSKDVLLKQAWHGLAVDENNLQVQISALRKAMGEGWIVTVSGRGYRLAAPPASATAPSEANGDRGKPSIAVLPFVNLSGDVSQEYLADGVSEDLIAALSRVRSFFVIARNSSFTYKGRSVDVRQVGHELGVRYVLEGSVRRSHDRLRITAQLIDAERGNHILAEQHDRDVGDVFTMQDDITRALVTALAPAISLAERQRAMRKPPENLTAWEAYQRALSHWSLRPDLSSCREFLQRAITLDGRFEPAHSRLALVHLGEAAVGAGLPLQEAIVRAHAAARTALELDPESALAHAILAWVFSFQGDPAVAMDEAEIAISLGPNEPQAHLIKGRLLTFGGKYAEAWHCLDAALWLDPRGAVAPSVMIHRLYCHYLAGDYLAAEAVAHRLIRASPELPRPYPWLAAALGQLGRTEQARGILDTATAVSPAFVDFISASRPPWFQPHDHEHLLTGLRKAGWRG
jgi:adenylate cyclase